MKKVVLKLDFSDDKIKTKAMKTVSGISGIESIAMDSKDKKLTVTGDIDPVAVVAKLRKLCRTDIISVVQEPEKKKEEPKKEEPKKVDGPPKVDQAAQFLRALQASQAQQQQQQPQYFYNQSSQFQPPQQPAYYYRSVEEDPNNCVIC